MNKVIFHEQLHKGLWEKVIEHAVASHRMKITKDSRGRLLYKDYPFDSVFTLLDALSKAPEESLEMSDSGWAVLLSDGDVERARANPCKGLGWRVKRIYDELQALSLSLETIEGAGVYDSDEIQKPLTFKELQDIIKFYRDDAKVFFDNLKIFIDRKKVLSQAWRWNWSVQLGRLFDIDDFQYTMNPSNQILEIEVLRKRYLIGRQIIDFQFDVLVYDFNRTHVPNNYRVEMMLWLRNYWTKKVTEVFQEDEDEQVEQSENEDEDENMVTCQRCGRRWDGMAQCPCGITANDTDEDEDEDEGEDEGEDEDEDEDDDDTDEEAISEANKRVLKRNDIKASVRKVQTIIDGELNGNIQDGIYIALMNQLKLVFDSCQ